MYSNQFKIYLIIMLNSLMGSRKYYEGPFGRTLFVFATILRSLWSIVKCIIPYNLAKYTLAYTKYYKTSELFKLRHEAEGEIYAITSFDTDQKHFIQKLTRKDKLEAFFIPFKYIG